MKLPLVRLRHFILSLRDSTKDKVSILFLSASVRKKIPEYKLYSGTDILKYTRGTTRIDKMNWIAGHFILSYV